MISPVKITGIELIKFNRRGAGSEIKELYIPSIFSSLRSAHDITEIMENIEFCDFVNGNMIVNDAKREKKETLPDNTKYPMFTDTFNKEDVWFSGEAMETSLSAMTAKNWSAMDKNILQKVMVKNNIVIDNFITKNTK